VGAALQREGDAYAIRVRQMFTGEKDWHVKEMEWNMQKIREAKTSQSLPEAARSNLGATAVSGPFWLFKMHFHFHVYVC
jgi:hypothetical protein